MLNVPHLSKTVRRALVGSAFAGAFFMAAPAAGATEMPHFDSAGLVQQASDALGAWGIDAPVVDPQVTAAVDAAVNGAAANAQAQLDQAEATAQQIAGQVSGQVAAGARAAGWQVPAAAGAAYDTPAQPLTNPNPIGLQEATQPDFKPQTSDPNYVWKNDLFSKVAAMRPEADFVLHRVPGSYFDAPRTPEESNQALTRGHSLYGPGTPLYINRDTMCTLTVAGYDAEGNKVGITAGHCGKVGQQVQSADSWQVGPTGTVVATNSHLDYAVIHFNDKAEVTRSYNGVSAQGLGGGVGPGEVACKRGVATGTTCGMVLMEDRFAQVNQVCSMVGDSGAPLLKNGRVVGSITGSVGPVSCRTPWQGAFFTPTTANNMDAVVADLNARGGIGRGFHLG